MNSGAVGRLDLVHNIPGPPIVVDVSALSVLDECALDRLVRLRLRARRLGTHVELVNASRELLDLLALAGLSDVFRSGVETNGMPEQPEELLVDEEVDSRDASI